MNEDFDILELIMSLEEKLSIPVFYLFCEEDLTQPYIIFKILDNRDNNMFDDKYISEYYNVEVTLWYTSSEHTLLYKKVKKELENLNFIFRRSYDLLDESSNKTAETVRYYGKLMDFRYKRFY